MPVLDQIKNLLQKKFTIDFLWNLAAKAVVVSCGLLLNILIGNHYGADGLGLFNKALAVYMIISIVSGVGGEASLVKHSAEADRKKLGPVVTSSLSGLFLISVLISLVVIGFLKLPFELVKDGELVYALTIMLAAIPFFTANKIMRGLVNGLRMMKLYAVSDVLRWAAVLAYTASCILKGKDLRWLYYVFLISEAVVLLVFFTCIRYLRLFTFDFSRYFFWLKKHIIFGSKLFLSNSISRVSTRIDILMVGYILTNTDTGVYSFASEIVKGLVLISSIMQVNFNPIISSLWAKKDHKKLDEQCRKLRTASVFTVLPLITAVGLVYPLMVSYFMKDAVFQQSFPAFYILLAGIAVFTVFGWSAGLLAMTGHPDKQINVALCGLFTNVIGNAVLIPVWGIAGAAAATSASYLLILLVRRYYIKKILGIAVF